MSVLWINHAVVSDEETYMKYAKAAGPVIQAHGGEFLVRGGAYRQMEGRERARNVVIRFPSMEAALTCYESADYQAALEHAKVSSERDVVIVEEVG